MIEWPSQSTPDKTSALGERHPSQHSTCGMVHRSCRKVGEHLHDRPDYKSGMAVFPLLHQLARQAMPAGQIRQLASCPRPCKRKVMFLWFHNQLLFTCLDELNSSARFNLPPTLS